MKAEHKQRTQKHMKQSQGPQCFKIRREYLKDVKIYHFNHCVTIRKSLENVMLNSIYKTSELANPFKCYRQILNIYKAFQANDLHSRLTH